MTRLLALISLIVILSGCTFPTWPFSKEPHPLPIDLTLDKTMSEKDRLKLFKQIVDRVGDKSGTPCEINFNNRTITLATYNQRRPYNFSNTTLHIVSGVHKNESYLAAIVKPKALDLATGDMCQPTFVNFNETRKNKEKYISIGASIFASFGMEIQSKYIRAAKDDENFVPIAAWVNQQLEDQNLAIRKAEEAKALAEELRVQALKDKRKKDIAARLERDSHLPGSIKQDKYLITLTDLLKNERYQDALFYFELLETMGSQQPSSFTYFWGESLYKVGQTKGALEKLYEYIRQAGSSGKYYTQALKLSNQAEQKLR